MHWYDIFLLMFCGWLLLFFFRLRDTVHGLEIGTLSTWPVLQRFVISTLPLGLDKFHSAPKLATLMSPIFECILFRYVRVSLTLSTLIPTCMLS